MTLDELKDKITQLIENELVTTHLEMMELSVFKRRNQWVVSAIMDRKTGSITLDECAELNRRISDGIESGGWMRDPYVMEVSSPGLDRPLKTAGDFRRAVGETLDMHYRGDAGRVRQGVYDLRDLDGHSLVLLDSKGAPEIRMRVDQVISAKRVLKFNGVRK